MGRRGPPPLPPNVVEMRGTAQKARQRDYTVEQIAGEVERPAYLKGKQRKKFDALVAKFARRGQQVVGLEDMIAVYAVELVRFEGDMRRGVKWTAAELNALRGLAVQFYDTAASQVQSSARPSENRFSGNGRRGRKE